MRSRAGSLDLPLPPDLARLRDRYAFADRQQNERTILEIATAIGKSRSAAERWMLDEIAAGRWTRREGYVNGKVGWYYSEANGQPIRKTQADPGVLQRTGRGGLFADWEPVGGSRRRTRGPRKARQARE
jgi:hypothetical protein